jgi:hypothetical protein
VSPLLPGVAAVVGRELCHLISRQQDMTAFRLLNRDSRRSSMKMTAGGALMFIIGASCSASGVDIVAAGGRAARIAGGLIMTVGLATFSMVVRRAAEPPLRELGFSG